MSDGSMHEAPATDPDAGSTLTAPRRRAPWIALAVAAVIAVLFVVLAGSEPRSNEAGDDSFRLGKPAPAVATTTLDGDPFDLSRRKGSWVVLNFFDSDCIPCKAEHPELVAFVERQAALGFRGAEFYTVIKGDSPDEVREFFADNGGSWTILTDDNGSISVAFGTAQVPETWIIDPDGIVRRRFAGPVTASGLEQELLALQNAPIG